MAMVMSVALADFGLARGVYNSEYYKVRGEDFLPLRWLAPECISKGVFSSKSDVWAFGILMYEIVGMGQKPYHNMDNNQVLVHVKNGGTPAKPAYCPDQLYKIMQLCWAYEKEQRPTFADILTMFEKLRDKSEFQDEKPFPPCSGHYNTAFDLSQDSTSSEKMGSEKGVSNQAFCDVERLSEQNRFDKSSNGNASTRKAMPTLVRSLRKENKAKPSPPPSLAELDARIQSSCASASVPALSNETLTTSCDYGSSYQAPSFASSSRSPLVLANLSSYEIPKKSSLTVENEHIDDSPHSRSWAGPQSRNRVNQSQTFALSIHPSQSDANTPQVTARKNRAHLPTPSSSYDSRRKSRVSQV